jgi:hypothetical protein
MRDLFFGAFLALATASPAICEELAGTVASADGRAVPGAKVVVHSSDGQISQAATTDASGQYIISGLDPGQYLIALDGAGNGVQGQTVTGYLGEAGLTVNWSVKPGTSPLATAQPGIHLNSASAVNVAGAAATASTASGTTCKKSGKRCIDNCQGNNSCQ